MPNQHGRTNGIDGFWRAAGADGCSGQLSKLGEAEAAGKLETPSSTACHSTHLERRVGLVSGVALIVGTMIGSGIFVSPRGVLQYSGSVGFSLVVWVASGVISLIGALSYAELGTLIPSSGAEYAYLLVGLGPLPAFLFSWVCVLVIKPSLLAIVCLTFAKYAVEAFTSGCDTDLAQSLVGVVTVGLVTYINCISVNLATRIQNIFTASKLFAIAVIVGTGAYSLAMGHVGHLRQGFTGTTTSVSGIVTAFYNGLWAYDGWNNLNYITEEIVNPSRNLPLSIIVALPLVTVCYLLINISYLAVMSSAQIIQSEAVALTFGQKVLGSMAWLMPLAVTMSTFGCANGTCFTAGRLCYAAAREGHLVDILSYVDVKRRTPSPAIIFNSLVAAALIALCDIGMLIDFFSFTVSFFYFLTMLALLRMRKTKPDAPRPYKVAMAVPIVMIFASVFLVVGPIIDNPKVEYLYAVGFMVTGLLAYFVFVFLKWTPGFMGKITALLQKLLNVVPTSYED